MINYSRTLSVLNQAAVRDLLKICKSNNSDYLLNNLKCTFNVHELHGMF